MNSNRWVLWPVILKWKIRRNIYSLKLIFSLSWRVRKISGVHKFKSIEIFHGVLRQTYETVYELLNLYKRRLGRGTFYELIATKLFCKKFSFHQTVTWSLPREEIPNLGTRPKIGLWQIFQLSIFVLSREKCHYQSLWIRSYRFFFPYFGFLTLLGKFEHHCL